MRSFIRFPREEDGPAAVEYAVMLALIVLAAAAAISALGTSISAVLESIGKNMGG